MRRVVAGVLAWALFACTWTLAARGGGRDAFVGAAVLLLSALAALALMRGWQAHNRAVYRRRGPRRSAVLHDQAWQQDRLGRRLDFGDRVATATEVVVASSTGVKTYRATT